MAYAGAAARADAHLPAVRITDRETVVPEDNLPTLIGYYEEAEQASATARANSERDRDYVDNKQLTEEEMAELKRRGQPPIQLNVIRSRAGFLGGLEKKQRRDPKCWPRNNPEDVQAAEAFTDGLRYAAKTAKYIDARSGAWKNITVEGYGGIELSARQNAKGEWVFTADVIPWDRLFYDPHSCKPNFSDAKYIGQVLWMDKDAAIARAVGAGADEAEASRIVMETIEGAPGAGRTYDDKPNWQVWSKGTKGRERVRIVMIWHREADGWKYCEFTRAGKLLEQDGAYVDQEGETYCPWIIESCNVDRDNNRYGELRHLIDPQDEINKRRSKALHLLNSQGVIAEAGAVEDINATRKELKRPDFYIEIAPGVERFEIVQGQELAAGQAAMGEQALSYVRETGENAALQGKTKGQSGRAIEAQQAGGLIEQSDVTDILRRLDERAFTAFASMMKQYWTAEKWIRVNDDEDAPQFIGLNVPQPHIDPMTGQPAIDPMTGEPIMAGVENEVAKLDLDIIIGDEEEVITLDGENYQAFLQQLPVLAQLPPPLQKLSIEMNPSLTSKQKKKFVDLLDQMQQASAQPPPKSPQQEAAENMELDKRAAEIDEKRAKTDKTKAETVKIHADAHIGAMQAVSAQDQAEMAMAQPQPVEAAMGPAEPAPAF